MSPDHDREHHCEYAEDDDEVCECTTCPGWVLDPMFSERAPCGCACHRARRWWRR